MIFGFNTKPIKVSDKFVENIAKMSEVLLSKGYELVYSSPVKGADNCLVNFIHPKSTNGVLIEISEKVWGEM